MPKRAGSNDYKSLRKKGEPAAPSTLTSNGRDWWNMKGADCAGALKAIIDDLSRQQAARLRQTVISARLYGNVFLRGVPGQAETRILQSQASLSSTRMTYNVVQSVIDTVVSRVGETKPRPYYLTDGGNYAEQRKAKLLNKYIEGVLYQNKGYDLGLLAFRDGGIFGDGWVKVFGRGGRVVLERTMDHELWVDDLEAVAGRPRRLHHVRIVDREELLSYFADADKKVLDAIKAAGRVEDRASDVSDMVRVCESWNLAAPDANGKMRGGCHALALIDEGSMLQEPEEYPYDVFPFAKVPWCPRPVGWHAQGLAEQLQGNQISLNKKLWLLDRSMHLAGTFKLLLKNGSKVVKEQANNEVGSVMTWAGDTPPQYITVQPIHEMWLMEIDREIQRAYELAGVSQLAAKSAKPAGLNSGKAIREFNDTESDRFRTIQRHNDNLYLQLAHLIVLVSKEMGSELRPVSVPRSRNTEIIDWKKQIGDVDTDSFVLQCFPVSRLPKDPAGRLQTIQEYIQAGFMTPREGRRALDFPDLESIESLANAQEDILCKTLDAIADEGEYATPEPTDDLILAKKMVLEYIQRGRANGLEESRLDLLRRWSEQVSVMQQQVAAEAQAMMQPPAVPMPPPVSDLLPNVAA